MKAINSLISTEIRFATSKETCVIQSSLDYRITDEGWRYYAHFTDVDTKAQRVSMTCLNHGAGE